MNMVCFEFFSRKISTVITDRAYVFEVLPTR